MKLHSRKRDHIVLITAAGTFLFVLVAISTVWPAAFGVVIAIGGALGALTVMYEVRLTKRLAQAEFIRDLQSGFTSDQKIGELWRKLLLDEEITASDRPLVSNYLTFFETLHLLLAEGALDLPLTDALFRNRFFTAVGNKGVLDTALIRHAGSFSNIHDLIETWHDYLLRTGVPIHPGYYSYVRALTEAKGYEVTKLGTQHLPDLLALEERVMSSLSEPSWLRSNSEVMLKESLAEQTVLGVRNDGFLVAAAILYDGGRSDESIKRYFTEDPGDLDQSINLKAVLTVQEHRRAGLGRTLVELLEQEATGLGKTEILCTIHPKNMPSKSLFKLLGYTPIGAIDSKYGKRDVYRRALPSLKKRWAR